MSQGRVISRVFSAPPELDCRAFADPDQLAQWWGPEGCSLRRETIESDPRAGGHQRSAIAISGRPGGQTRLELRQGPFTEQMAADVQDAWQESVQQG